VIPGLKGFRESKGSRVTREIKVTRVTLGLQVYRDSRERRETKVIRVIRVRPVNLVWDGILQKYTLKSVQQFITVFATRVTIWLSAAEHIVRSIRT
jgi:hypothetical protein